MPFLETKFMSATFLLPPLSAIFQTVIFCTSLNFLFWFCSGLSFFCWCKPFSSFLCQTHTQKFQYISWNSLPITLKNGTFCLLDILDLTVMMAWVSILWLVRMFCLESKGPLRMVCLRQKGEFLNFYFMLYLKLFSQQFL